MNFSVRYFRQATASASSPNRNCSKCIGFSRLSALPAGKPRCGRYRHTRELETHDGSLRSTCAAMREKLRSTEIPEFSASPVCPRDTPAAAAGTAGDPERRPGGVQLVQQEGSCATRDATSSRYWCPRGSAQHGLGLGARRTRSQGAQAQNAPVR
jgi:hypothetical protein